MTQESVIEIIDVKRKVNSYTVTIRTDTETFNRMMSKGRLYIGWDSCRCFDNLHAFIGRCFKCLNTDITRVNLHLNCIFVQYVPENIN